MNLTAMLSIVRRDLKDEDPASYRWTDNELTRHIQHAAKDFSGKIPLEQKTNLATISGSREIDISSLSGRIHIEAVEYPLDQFPPMYQRFALWQNTLTLIGEDIPDGANCRIYYTQLHTLDETTSTIPPEYEDLVACGAGGYAALAWAGYAINQVNTGGTGTPQELLTWGREQLQYFRSELKRLGKNNRVRVGQLYTPFNPPVSQTTDYGPSR